MGIPDHLTCFLRNLYASQEATVRTRHGTTDWFQIGEGVYQDCILSPYLFNFSVESGQFSCSFWLFVMPWTAACQASLSISNSWSLLKLTTISSSAVSFSSCLQSFPASGSFPRSQFFTSGGQSTGVSASASVLPMNIQDWFPFDWFDLLTVQGILKSLLQHHSSKLKHQLIGTQLSL